MTSSVKFRTPIGYDIKATSNAAWWVKNPGKGDFAQEQHGKRQKQSFAEDMGDLFRNISLHGYSKLVDRGLGFSEKLIWLSVHMVTFSIMVAVLSLTWEQFVAKYVVITLQDPVYPIEKVPFPAVSICSNNRISFEEATLYANELAAKSTQNKSVQYFMDHIKFFRNLYYAHKYEADDDSYLYADFQIYLDNLGTEDNELFYNTREHMKRLSPKCNETITKCMLAGVEVDCFTEKTFQDHMTNYGPCCTFNLHDSYKERSLKDRYFNSDLGLTVILNTSRNDDYSVVLNIDGYLVMVHSPDSFPDIRSGSTQEVFPTKGEESFVSIRARIMDTDEKLIAYDPQTRKCYLDDEAPDPSFLRNSTYSFNNCISRCRVRSIIALCQCVPFYTPLDLLDSFDGLIYCTLQHVNCLFHYNNKWRSVLTRRDVVTGLDREMEEALYCPQCLPSCDDVQYLVSLMSLPLNRYTATLKKDDANSSEPILNFEDISVLRVHFGEPHAPYYRRLVGNSWIEAFSTIGNIVSIFIGFSIMAMFEILFFFMKNFLTSLNQFYKREQKRSQLELIGKNGEKGNTGSKGNKGDAMKLYICP